VFVTYRKKIIDNKMTRFNSKKQKQKQIFAGKDFFFIGSGTELHLTCRNDVEHAWNGLAAELVVAPAEQGAVVHLRLGLVAGDAHGPVDDDVLRRNGQHLTGRVELPTVEK